MIYVDTSALIKLVLLEEESAALTRRLAGRPELVCSALLLVESRRTVQRRAPDRLPRLDLLLGRVDVIDVSGAVIESAGRLPDPLLRSLDAIHLATALLIREALDAFLTYDERLGTAAAGHGLTVEMPGGG